MAESSPIDDRFETLVGVLRAQAQRRGEQEAYRFLLDGESKTVAWSYRELDLRVRALAVTLGERARAGERAVLLYPPGLDYIAAFFGCLYAGVIAVPAYPPTSRRSLPRLEAILHDARPALVLTSSAVFTQAAPLIAARPELARLEWLVSGAAEDPVALQARAQTWRDPGIGPETVAFLQYTSGSTSVPKGVEIRHGNLIHNQRLIRDAFENTSASVIVGWLPLYHDMGLIGNVMQPLFLGARCILMSPLAFLKRPASWLEAISHYRGTTSGGPNFGYELCLRKITPDERARLDLSSWKVAYNGAEPVRAGTLERFSAAFAAQGFRAESFYPCYGLAEATLFVTGGVAGRGAPIVTAERKALEQDRVVLVETPGATEPSALSQLVGCGRSPADQRVLIVDPKSCAPLAAERVGEIWVAGPSVAGGYWCQPEASAQVFSARTASGEGPFLRTGDLGFLTIDGELVVTGRLKDLIILRGRNYYPQDLELASEASHPALRAGGAAAFSFEAGEEEQLAIVQEVEHGFRGEVETVAAAIRRSIAEQHQAHVHTVVLIRGGSLAKTSSGKVRRQHTKQLFLEGQLDQVGLSRVAGVSAAVIADAVAGGPSFNREELRLLGGPARRAALLDYLRYLTARVARQAPEAIDPAIPLTALGLDSLMAVELKNQGEAELGVDFPLAELLEGPSLERLGQLLEPLLLAAPGSAERVPELVPGAGTGTGTAGRLSHGQRALWFLQQLAPESSAYNVAAAVRVTAGLDLERLRAVLELLALRHGALRTSFRATPEGPRQEVAAEPRIEWQVEEAPPAGERALAARVAQEASRPFDLERDALMRVLVLRGEAEHVVMLVFHHVICDLASLGVLLGELRTLFALPREHAEGALQPLPLGYGDYVDWQERLLDSAVGEQLWQYWQQQLAGELPVLSLPTDRPRPTHQSFRGAAQRRRLGAPLSAGLRALAEACNTTLFTVLLAAFQTLLARASGQREILVGTPALGRTRSELGGLVGYFVNPVVMRTRLHPRTSFAQLLAAVRKTTIEALVHQDYPFALLVERLQPQRDPSRSPIFQVMLGLQRTETLDAADLAAFVLGSGDVELDFAGLPARSLPLAQPVAQFDLELVAAEIGGRLGFSLLYDTELFDATTAARLLERFCRLLAGAAAEPHGDALTLPLLAPAERQALCCEWQGGATSDDPERLFHRLLAAQVARTPDRPAIFCAAATLTYAELSRRANRLARALLAHGAAPERHVAVLTERGLDLASAIVAIFKIGAVYVPLDPRYPEERLRQILAPCRSVALLVGTGLSPLAERTVAGLDAAPPRLDLAALLAAEDAGDLSPVFSPDHLAYVIFTSGSTGAPKGAMVSHRGMLNHLEAKIADLAISAADTVAQNASQCFDISVWQFLAALLVGGSVRIFPDAVAHDPERLAAEVAATAVTLFETVPSLLRAMLAPPAPAATAARPVFRALRWLIPTGEALAPELARQWLELYPEVPLLNAYGPTECSDDVTHAVIDRAPGARAVRVPIGRPIRNTRLHVLDAAFAPVPPGVAGELCVGGLGVGRGYLGAARRTASTFRPDPWSRAPGGRLYKTGDLGRHLSDGQLELLGRIDTQVKVRGFRIELGEVETVLGRHPAVGEAVVVVGHDAFENARLIAFWVARRAVAEISQGGFELRRWAAAALPEPMVPSLFVALRALPLGPSGKVDRKALLDMALPELEAERAAQSAETALGPTEELVARIWSEVLGLPGVSVEKGFFDLGGHSLLATQVVARIRDLLGVELELRELFENPTVRALARRLEERRREALATAAAALPPLVPVARERPLPLSFAQERLWFLDQLLPGLAAYNMPAALVLAGAGRIAALERALAALVERHETLRTRFETVDGAPVQIIAPSTGESILSRVDLRALAPAAASAQARRLAADHAERPFDLRRGPLLRTALVELGGEEDLLLINLHHTIADGWSLQVLIKELSAFGWSFATGEPAPLLPLPVQYADFAVWQRSWLEGERRERLLAYWREQLRGAPEFLDLPLDRPRPPVVTHRGASLELRLPAELAARLETQARRHTVTLFMALLAAFQSLLHRTTGQRDVLVGAPIAGRTRTEVEGLIGFFVNTLVLRTDFTGDPSFAALLGRAREGTLGAYAHQDLPFEKLVEHLQPERHLGHTPLFQVLFALQDPPFAGLELPGLRLTPLERYREEPAKFDLELYTWREGESFAGHFVYNTDLFDATTVRRMAQHFCVLLASALAAPEQRVSQLALLGAAEAHLLLAEANDTARAQPPVAALHELVAAQTRLTPEAIAVVFEHTALCYGELARRSHQLAHHLRRRGVGPETRVGVAMERSLELIIALLGVLEAGAAYVPLDPSYPPSRLTLMVEDARPPVLLTQAHLVGGLPASTAELLCLDAGWQQVAQAPGCAPAPLSVPDHLAYVIFTSGSTGRPKGVMNSHGAVCNRLQWMLRSYSSGPGDRVLQKTPFSFDVSVWELFWPLATGACLVMARPGGHRDSGYLVRTIVESRITTLHFVPSMLRAFLDDPLAATCTGLRRVIASGEALTADLRDAFAARLPARLDNLYGPTEAAIEVTWWPCTGDTAARVPIGRPLDNTQIHVLDRHLRPVPLGVSGELLIGGVQLARGYLERPALSAERFVPDPSRHAAPGCRVYRTGDLARRRRDGAVEYLGRIDTQVKVRGFRIELGEIETVLQHHPEVQRAAVLAHTAPAGDQRLIACVVSVPGRASSPTRIEELRRWLLSQLPEHMVPAFFVPLESLPLGPSGKLDRTALLALADQQLSRVREGVAPRTPQEELLAGIWGRLLGREQIGVRENFFELGGHSLLATQLISRVRASFGVEMPLASVFEHPTVERFAAALAAVRHDPAAPAPPPLVAVPRDGRPLPVSYAQEGLWLFDQLASASAVFNLFQALELSGPLDVAVFERCFATIFARHESLRTVIRRRGREPVQVIDAQIRLEITRVDLSGLPERAQEGLVRRLGAEHARYRFRLDQAPLLRITLLRLGAAAHVVLVVMHHVIGDDWSTEVLQRELAELYDAYLHQRPSPLPELPIQHADYALWQRRWLTDERLEPQLAYWKQRLHGKLPVLALQTGRRRPAAMSFRGSRHDFRLPAELSAAVETVARRLGATPFMTLLAAFAAVLHRTSGQDDVIIGAPVAHRDRPEIEGLIGFFVNVLPLRLDLTGAPSYRQLLERVRQVCLEAYDHQDLPFERLVSALGLERGLGHPPIRQTTFSLLKTSLTSTRLGAAVTARPIAIDTGTAQLDLGLLMWRDGEVLAGTCEYATDLFDAPTIRGLIGAFEAVLTAGLDDPEVRIATAQLLSPAELEQLTTISRPAGTRIDFEPPLQTAGLHQLFAAQAARSPEAIAVACGEQRLSYRELERRAGQLARRLRALGAGPESRVGLFVERSLDSVIGILGILASGAAYLPLDPAYPAPRLAFMLEDAQAELLVTQEPLRASLPAAVTSSTRVLVLGTGAPTPTAPATVPAEAPVHPDQLAYVIYTSGSTGAPKGTLVSHRNATRLFAATRSWVDFHEHDVWTLFHSCAFDFSVWEIWGALLFGGRVVVVPYWISRAPDDFYALLLDERVTVLNQTPSAFQQLVRCDARRGAENPAALALRLVVFGGEALEPTTLAPWYERHDPHRPQLVNMYGITETTVHVTCYPLRREDTGSAASVIGRSIADWQIHLLDRRLERVPIGISGEIHVGGAGVCRGYHRRPALSAQRFIPDPFAQRPGERLYRAGDLARYGPGGDLVFLGRSDRQVKIRGFRIELGEITAVIARHEQVGQVVVSDWRDDAGTVRLAAWVTPAGATPPDAAQLRRHTAAELPEYMVPAVWTVLAELPLTPSGKIDHRALPAPNLATAAGGVEAEPTTPTTPLESFLASVFAEVLGVETVATRTSFFDLGGSSLLAAQVVSLVQDVLPLKLELRNVFEAPTVAAIAAQIEASRPTLGGDEQKLMDEILADFVRMTSGEDDDEGSAA